MYPALIPARGGSKGIPKKNLARVGSLPLVVRNILALTNSRNISEVYVSTDDPNIASISASYGAYVINRPPNISNDTSSTDDVISHFLNHLVSTGKEYDWFILSQATYPFLSASHVDALVEARDISPQYDSYFAATNFHSFIWDESEDEEGIFKVANHAEHFSARARRQDLKPQYIELGSVYLISSHGFKASFSRFGFNPRPVPLPCAPILEIDSLNDLEDARLLESKHRSSASCNKMLKSVNLIAVDFDGVLTDNNVFTDSTGVEIIKSNKADSLAIRQIIDSLGIKVIIVTSELSSSHTHRAKKIGVEIHQVRESKGVFISKLIDTEGAVNKDRIKLLYIGNDTNDLSVRPYADIFACPSDSHPEVMISSDIIINAKGGQGVMRELLSLLLTALNS